MLATMFWNEQYAFSRVRLCLKTLNFGLKELANF